MTHGIHVTGLGWSTPLGDGIEDVWQQLLAGHDGFAPLGAPFPLRNELAASVPSVPPGPDHGARLTALAAKGLRAAFADAGLDPAEDGVALVLGTSYGAHLDEEAESLYDWAGRCAEAVAFPGAPVCVSTACSAASDALLVGAELVRSGRYRAVVCGGADILTPAKRLAHSMLGTMTGERLRAFDTGHSGMLLGEGAGFLVLEPDASRAGRSYAVLRGVGASNDAVGLTAPAADGRTVRTAVERALADSGLGATDIAAVSAHGTGTVLNDEAEARGLAMVFGEQPDAPAVFGTKGALGHSLGACGAVEAITLVLALRDRTAPPVAGLRTPIGEAAGLVRPGRRTVHGTAGVSLTLGFGGFNTALVFTVDGGTS
ncbi:MULTISPECIES: beta-ketoacyl synthase N-terminal-like domain-containing protein [Streptomyces]|uniref:Beta-ketoacyl-[acyl-carrier-protein] synthase family protein n=1 Tax=Streptomyces morookaense TaxID=1970 RepID=A0A7Y7B1F3_STRMO|nr:MULTISPECIES: beta-ketoacyl synthase N-terminal-like domain-containing protein [Streptomyces]MCC2278696.1 beta-ketoacyl-[acyl-carrier-protein] synthase family protein [Streptomyces sp. ET3-23]NVK77285.1 beta-ketoacyl-[acyl-carrier-protein] synthase family protein [Streptomyces morookaense]GHF18065.1 beta-ketoacyl synthetase [Streptomyces morookaense]